MRLQDKVIVVTAATRGIGAAIVKACAQEGTTVYIGARNMERAQAEVDEMTAAGLAVKCVYNDASKPDSYQSMIDTVVAAEGRIDGLVNNFGGTNPAEDKDLLSTSYEHFLAGVDANVGSVFLGCQAAAREMAKTGGGFHREHQLHRRQRARHQPNRLRHLQGGYQPHDEVHGGAAGQVEHSRERRGTRHDRHRRRG